MANNTNKKKGLPAPKQAPKKQPPKNVQNRSQGKAQKPRPAAKEPAASEERIPVNNQKIAIIVMAFAAFMFAVALIPGDNIWAVMHDGLFRLFGFCAYLIPVLIIFVSITYARESTLESISVSLTEVGILSLITTGVIYLFSHKDKAYIAETGLAQQIYEAWVNGAADKKGGATGAIIGGGLGKLFGKTGAEITLLIAIIILIFFLTGLSLPVVFSYIRRHARKVSDVTNQKIEQRKQEKEQRELEEVAEEAEREAQAEAEKKKGPPVIADTKTGKRGKTGLQEPQMAQNVISSVPDSNVKLPGRVDVPVTPVPVPAVPVPVPKDSLIPKKETKPAEAPKPAKKPAETSKKGPVTIETAPGGEITEKHDYVFPSIECLNKPDNSGLGDSEEEMERCAAKLIDTLQSFKISAQITDICRGPSVTRYELVPEAGVRISKITSLSDDIALRLAAKSVRIEAPIPGKSAIGIEIPNIVSSMVAMREIIDTDQYRAGVGKSKLNVALGKDITGNIITMDITKMPHLLVAGTTGSGKSVCMNAMIISILYNATPDEVRLLMIDPKSVEFTVYNGIAHLEVPVVSDPRKAAGALSWAVSEMEKRYRTFTNCGARDIKSYNKMCMDPKNEGLEKMHHIVIFIDELSDLMMAAPKEVEDSICRLAQMARAAGIHLVLATQSPRADIITGLIKANIPSRISLKVASPLESRIILDDGGAEKLLGNGDLLFKPIGQSKPTRVQGCYISDEEINAVVEHIKSQGRAEYSDEIQREIEAKAAAADKGTAETSADSEDLDPMFEQAAEVVILAGEASTTMLQKKLKLGYARASRVIDQLEEHGIVGPKDGAKPREVLITKSQWYEQQALSGGSGRKDVQMTFDGIGESPAPAAPVYEEPSYEEPVYEEPAYEEPSYEEEEPAYGEPEAEDEESEYGEPAYEEPVYEEAKYDEYEDIYSSSEYYREEEEAEAEPTEVPMDFAAEAAEAAVEEEIEETAEETEAEEAAEEIAEAAEETPAVILSEVPPYEPQPEEEIPEGEEDEDDGFDFLDDEDEDYTPTVIDDVFSDDDDYAGVDDPFYED